MHATDKAARVAGALYLVLGVIAVFGLMVVPGALIVRGDAAATASKVLASETLFRLGIASDLLGSVVFILLVLALYRLLSGVDRSRAALMVVFAVVSATIGFINALNNVAALTLFRGGDFLAVLDETQREALGMLFIRLHGQGHVINEVFWGLWLLPLGALVSRSGFLPRILGLWLIVAGFAWVALSATGLFAPQHADAAFRIAQPAVLGEIALALWLTVVGARMRPASKAA